MSGGRLPWLWRIVAVFVLVEVSLGLLGWWQQRAHEAAASEASVAFPEPRATVCLNGMWRAHAAPDDRAPFGGGWTEQRIPEVMNPDTVARDAAWYETRVFVPASWKERQTLLRFDKIRHYARVYWNGRPLAEHYGSRVGFEVDVSEATRWGEYNDLRLYVASASRAGAWPGVRVADSAMSRFYTTDNKRVHDAFVGGDVLLVRRPWVRVEYPQVVTAVTRHALSVAATVRNRFAAAARLTVRASVRRDGRPVLTLPEQTLEIGPGAAGEFKAAAPWDGEQPWGPRGYGDAVRYALVLDVLRDGVLQDRSRTWFGFREVAMRGKQWTLNGRPLFITGTRVPEAYSERHFLACFFHTYQELGVDTFESHCESRNAGFYEAADAMGVMLISGNYCSGAISPNEDGCRPDETARQALAGIFHEWGLEERDHPGVVMWGTCCMDHNVREPIYKPLAEVDPTRPLPFRDFVPYGIDPLHPAPWPADGRAVFIKETIAPDNREARVASEAVVLAPFLKSIRAKVLGVVLPALPGAPWNVRHLPWPSTSGLDPRPAELTVPLAFPPQARLQAQRRLVNSGVDAPLPPAPPQERPFPPEAMIRVTRGGAGVAGAVVVLQPLDGQDAETAGVVADAAGRAWFLLREPGRYRARVVPDTTGSTVDVAVRPVTVQDLLTLHTFTETELKLP